MNIYYNAKRKNTPGVIKAKTYGYDNALDVWLVLKIYSKEAGHVINLLRDLNRM